MIESTKFDTLFYSAQRPREAAAEARAWLLDCFADEESREEIGLLNHIGLVEAVERQYEGGYLQFLQDSFNLKGQS